MLADVESLLLSIPQEYFYFGFGGVIFLTGLSLFPSQNDLMMISAALLASKGILKIEYCLPICFVSLIGAEALMFFLGGFLGENLLHKPFIQKRLSLQMQGKIEKKIEENRKKVFATLRFVPMLRPLFILAVSSFSGEHRREFFGIHFVITFIYIPTLMLGVYFFGQKIFT